MRHDLHLYGKTPEDMECEAIISVYANDPEQVQQEVEWWTPRLAWFLTKKDSAGRYPEIPDGVPITVERVESFEKQQPRFERMQMPSEVSELFGGLFKNLPPG